MNQTEKIIEVGECRARIFGTVIETATGPMTLRNVTLQRIFRSKDGNVGTAYSFRENDVPKAILALSRAYELMVDKQTKKKREQQGGQGDLKEFRSAG